MLYTLPLVVGCVSQGRASPRLRDALHAAARAAARHAAIAQDAAVAQDAAAGTGTNPAAAALQTSQTTEAAPDQQPVAAVHTSEPPANRLHSPFVGSPSPESPALSGLRASDAPASPSQGDAAAQTDHADRPGRQASLMAAWLPQPSPPPVTAATTASNAPRAVNLSHPQPASQPSQQRVWGANDGQLADMCAQQAELRPFWRTSLPDVDTPRLSHMAGWAALTSVVQAPSNGVMPGALTVAPAPSAAFGGGMDGRQSSGTAGPEAATADTASETARASSGKAEEPRPATVEAAGAAHEE